MAGHVQNGIETAPSSRCHRKRTALSPNGQANTYGGGTAGHLPAGFSRSAVLLPSIEFWIHSFQPASRRSAPSTNQSVIKHRSGLIAHISCACFVGRRIG